MADSTSSPEGPLAGPAAPARRRVLGAGAVAVGALGLAACGDSGTATDTAGDGVAPAPTTAGAGSTGAATGAETGAVAPGGIPVAEVPVGSGAIFPEEKVVVTQPTEGEFKAFDTTCPHQGCAVASVQDTSIMCPCHGSVFDTATGDRVSGPAPRGLTEKSVEVSGDSVIVS